MAFLGCDHKSESIETVRVSMETKNYSDLLKFRILPPVGSEEVEIEGDTIELLKNIPYLFSSGVIPSVDIINEVLAKGLSDAGMSGGARWTPYQIDTNSFEEFVTRLKEKEGFGSLEYIEPDTWVSGFEDWNVWVMHIKKGIPWKEHKQLNDIVVSLEHEMGEAKVNGNEQRINALHLQIVEAGTNLSEFVMENMQ
jgi:hypothetical protein